MPLGYVSGKKMWDENYLPNAVPLYRHPKWEVVFSIFSLSFFFLRFLPPLTINFIVVSIYDLSDQFLSRLAGALVLLKAYLRMRIPAS